MAIKETLLAFFCTCNSGIIQKPVIYIDPVEPTSAPLPIHGSDGADGPCGQDGEDGRNGGNGGNGGNGINRGGNGGDGADG